MLRRNSPASKLSRALSNKSVSRPVPEDGLQGGLGLAPCPGPGSGLPGTPLAAPVAGEVIANGDIPKPLPKLRQFIMEAPAQFTTVRPKAASKQNVEKILTNDEKNMYKNSVNSTSLQSVSECCKIFTLNLS